MKWLTKRLVNRFSVSVWGWCETLIISAVIVALGIILQPQDPLFIHSAFPWVWLGPVLIGLRYGVAPGLVTFILVCVGVLAIEPQYTTTVLANKLYLFGGFLFAVICGEFSSRWNDRLRHSEELSGYTQTRLTKLSNAYYVIKQSHDLLEREAVVKPMSLQAAVADLRRMLVDTKGILTQPIAQALLTLLAQHCDVHQAGIFLFKQGEIKKQALAYLGSQPLLNADDVLVTHCIEHQNVSFYAVNQLTDERKSEYLVCAPIITSRQQLLGLLVVSDMSFVALHRDNLEMVKILLDYFADSVSDQKASVDVLASLPWLSPEFAFELTRLCQVKAQFGIESTVMVMSLPDFKGVDNLMHQVGQQHEPDHVYLMRLEHQQLLMIILPFANDRVTKDYQHELHRWLSKKEIAELVAGSFGISYVTVTAANPLMTLTRLVGEAVLGRAARVIHTDLETVKQVSTDD